MFLHAISKLAVSISRSQIGVIVVYFMSVGTELCMAWEFSFDPDVAVCWVTVATLL